MDWWIIGNAFPSNISNSEWVTFLGAYIGSIIGAIASVIGIGMTIHFSKISNKTDHELQVRPYCSIQFYTGDFSSFISQIKEGRIQAALGRIVIENIPSISNTEEKCHDCFLQLTNVGLGTAIEIKYRVVNLEIDSLETAFFIYNNIRDADDGFFTTNTLRCNETTFLRIEFKLLLDSVLEQDIIELIEGKRFYSPSAAVKNKYGKIKMTLEFLYKDILENTYTQAVELCGGISLSAVTPIEIEHPKMEYDYSISLENVEPPKKIKSR